MRLEGLDELTLIQLLGGSILGASATLPDARRARTSSSVSVTAGNLPVLSVTTTSWPRT